MEARVQGCTTCHGQSGQGTGNDYFPRIAGKPAGYLYNQLVAFRDGKRRYAPMNYLVAYLPDAYLREIAEHYAKQRPPFVLHESVPADTASLDRGQALARTGDAEERHPGLHLVPRRESHRHGTGHPRARRLAPELHRGAARPMAGRRACGSRSRTA
jgi:cytochrome c553